MSATTAPPYVKNVLGTMLERKRLTLGLAGYQMAERMKNVSASVIFNAENGGTMSLKTFFAIADELGIDASTARKFYEEKV